MEWWGWLLTGAFITFLIYTVVILILARKAIRKMGIDPQVAIQAVKMMRGNNSE